MEYIRQGRPGEGDRLRAFAEAAFSFQGAPVDFAALLPKVYQAVNDHVQEFLLMENDQEIMGLLCRTVSKADVFGRTLRLGHIGSVCTSPKHRGSGVMRRLMQRALQDLEAEGCDLILLNGNRQRYENFSFQLTGSKMEFVFPPDQKLAHEKPDSFHLREMEEADLPFVEQMYQAEPSHMRRPRSEIMRILHSWGCRPWILESAEEQYGYCAMNCGDNGQITVYELHLQAPRFLRSFCALLMEMGRAGLKLILPPDASLAAEAAALCQWYSLGTDRLYNILNFAPVANALLAQRHQAGGLPEGAYAIHIDGVGVLALRVSGEQAEARLDPRQPAAVSLSRRDAVQFLFSPYCADRQAAVCRAPFLAAWLPLPLFVRETDGY